jgi:nitrogen regulatory protein P-II 2
VRLRQQPSAGLDSPEERSRPRFIKDQILRSRFGTLNTMKLIIAIIQPTKLEEVKAALTEVEVFRLTVMDCQGFGRQKGQTEVYRGHEITVNLLRKVQLQIAVNDEFVERTVDAILKGGRSGEKGQIGDGKIFILPMDDCIRIRTGERGQEAI